MNKPIRCSITKSVLSLALLATSALTTSLVNAANYKIDSSHTQILFKIKHLAIATVTGSFGEFEGEFQFDPENIAKSSAKAQVVAKSINTNNEKRDDHLRNEDFFNVEKYPSLGFVSKEIKDVNGNNFTLVGDLTIGSVTKGVEFSVEYAGAAKDPWGNDRVAFTAETKINRKDFGLTWNKVMETGGLVVGDDVKIILEVEGVKEK
ncbi:MAG TPA: YceI family protein [Oligoflexia bacterium]|nr:YceI family protein [Oligoflexia bacterium]HMP49001.1 YceI family protein [Oligoflexia bacterium]